MRIGKWVAGLAMALGLVACGGSGDAGTSPWQTTPVTPPTGSATVALSLNKSAVTAAAPVTATASVLGADGNPAGGVVVKFSTAQSYVTLSADTVTTDNSGKATTTLTVRPGQGYGADVLTAALAGSAGSATSTASFTANGANTVEVLGASTSVASGGDQVAITAIVKGSGNVGLANVPVTITTDSGTILSSTGTTDASGVATAKYSVGGDKSNRTVTITATSGSASGVLTLPVEGSKLTVSGAATMAMGAVNTYNVKATDSRGNGVVNATISATSLLGNALSSSSVTTNSQGVATFTYTATKAGSDMLTFTGMGSSSKTEVAVSAEDFTVITPATDTIQKIPLGTSERVAVQYRVSGVPKANQTVYFTSTAGVLSASSAVTDSNGQAAVTISSAWAAPATIRAQLSGGTAQVTIPVTFVAKVPSRVVLQITPTAIGPNPQGSTTNQAQMVAKVTDANGNPVSSMIVNFSSDVDGSGGQLQQPSGPTDENGVAIVQYVSGPQSTSNNGVRLRATVQGYPAVTGTASLTVSQSALFIALGTGNTITNLDPQTYKKQWTVYVTDANGVAVPNVNITAKILPKTYRKGSLFFNGDNWVASPWNGVSPAAQTDEFGQAIVPQGYYISCQNEDSIYGDGDTRSFNGVMDAGEDTNGNATLEPGNVIALDGGTVKTDPTANGRATLTLIYAETYVPWIEVRLQVQAVVSGTASTTEAAFVVPGFADDFKDKTVAPAGVISPFGRRVSCSDKL